MFFGVKKVHGQIYFLNFLFFATWDKLNDFKITQITKRHFYCWADLHLRDGTEGILKFK